MLCKWMNSGIRFMFKILHTEVSAKLFMSAPQAVCLRQVDVKL